MRPTLDDDTRPGWVLPVEAGTWIVENAGDTDIAMGLAALGPEWFLRRDVPLGSRTLPYLLVGPPGAFAGIVVGRVHGRTELRRAERIATALASRLRRSTCIDISVQAVVMTMAPSNELPETGHAWRMFEHPADGVRALQVQHPALRPEQRHLIRLAVDDDATAHCPLGRLADRVLSR